MLIFGFLKNKSMSEWIERAIKLIIVFALISVPLVFNPWAIEQFDIQKMLVFQALVEIAFFLWIALLLIRRNVPQFTPLTIALFVYMIALSVSALAGVDPLKSIWGSAEEGIGIVGLWHFFAFYLVIASVSWRSYHRRLISVLFWTGIATVFIGLFQKYIWWPPIIFWPGTSDGRIASTFSNAPHFAAFLLFIVFFGLFLLAETRHKRLRFMYGGGAILATIAIFLTKTRGSIIALLGGLCVLLFFFLIYGKRIKIFQTEISMRRVSAGILIALAFFVGTLITTRSATIWKEIPGLDRLVSHSTEKNLGNRIEMWRTVPDVFQERPVLGWGWRNFDIPFNELGIQDSPAIGALNDKPFNVILEHLVAGGIIGLIAYLGIFLALAYQMKKTWRGSSIFLAAAVTGSILQNLVLFDTVASYIPLFLLFAFIDTEYRGAQMEKNAHMSSMVQYGIVGIALLFSFVPMYAINWKTAYANHNYYWGMYYLERSKFTKSYAHITTALETKTPYADQMMLDYAEHAATKSRNKSFSEDTDFVSLNKTATRMLESYTQQHPSSFQYHFTLGSFYLAFRHYSPIYLASADEHLQIALARAPKKAGAYLATASISLARGENSKADAEINTAVSLGKKFSDKRILRAVLYANLGEDEKSYIALSEALAEDIYPIFVNEYIILGDVSADQGSYRIAADLYERALTFHSLLQARERNTRFKLGLIYQKLGEYEQAYTLLNQLKKDLLDNREYTAAEQVDEILNTIR